MQFHEENKIISRFFFQERENVESLFSLDYGRNYFQGHETRHLAQLVAIIKAKEPEQDGLFKHNGLLDLAKKIDDTVHGLHVKSELHGIIQFKDVCALTRTSEGRECQKNKFIELSPRMDKIRSGRVNMTFPQFEDPVTETSYFMPAFFGNITTTTLITDDDDGDENFRENDFTKSFNNNVTADNIKKEYIIKEVTAIRLYFILDASTANEEKRLKGEIWERTALRYVLDKVCIFRLLGYKNS